MKRILLLLLFPIVGFSQNIIEWSPDYKLQLSDFASPETEIGRNEIALIASPRMEFMYQMSVAQFMFTKNFNSKVTCDFMPNAAALVAPDEATALKVVKFAQYQFDLCELYSRKFRKQLFESKGAFSNTDFFKSAYENVQKELAVRSTKAGKETNLGQNEEKLKQLQDEVLAEIAALPDYCKTCKPPKKKN